MNNMISNSSLHLFINKIHQHISQQQQDKKQKYMETQQQFLQNQELFNLSAALLKENLYLDEAQFQQFKTDQKFHAYIHCIEKVGLMLSKFYQQRETDHHIEIKTLKDQNQEFKQKLTNYMELNQTITQNLQYYLNIDRENREKLDKSQHQLEKGKHQIQNQITANERLLRENQKLMIKNNELENQNDNLKSIIQELQIRLNEKAQQANKLKNQVFRSRKQLQTIEQQCNNLKAQKYCIQKEVESLQILIEEKDYILGNNPHKQGQELTLSAEHNYPYFLNSTKIVRQQHEEGDSDKQIMKGIQNNQYRIQPILALKFSRSISATSQISQTSLQIVQVQIPTSNQKQSPQPKQNKKQNRKLLKTDRTRKDSSNKKQKQQFNKSCSKMQDKIQQNQKSVSKALFGHKTPRHNQSRSKQKLMTSKTNKDQINKQKFENECLRNASAQNNSKIKYNKIRSNASVVLNPRKKNKEQQQKFIKKGRIEHSQSVQDLYQTESVQFFEKQNYEKQLQTKQKLIKTLKNQNKSVRQLFLQQSQKRTQAQHQYEQSIQRLKSQLSYFKNQLKNVYRKYIQQKALSKVYQDQFMNLSQQIQRQRQQYERVRKQLKQKCKRYMQQKISYYKQKYEQIQLKMKEMEISIYNGSKQDNQLQLEGDSQQNSKQLKKCKSNSLFYKEVKHHSYNTSQQYSEINHLSANHSKNTSIINMDDEQLNDKKYTQIIKIQDYCQQKQYEIQQLYEQLQSFRQQKTFQQQQVQTQLIQFIFPIQENYQSQQTNKVQDTQNRQYEEQQRVTLQYSLKYNQSSLKFNDSQRYHDSSQISYQFSSLGLKSSQDYKFSQQNLKYSQQNLKSIEENTKMKIQKIKKLSLNRLQSIMIQYQKSGLSDFDNLQIGSKIQQTLNTTIQIPKTRPQNFYIQKVVELNVDNLMKQKIDKQAQTNKLNMQLSKNIQILINPTQKEYNLNVVDQVSIKYQPQIKIIQTNNYQIQTDILQLCDKSIQTKSSQIFNNQTQTQCKQWFDKQVQTFIHKQSYATQVYIPTFNEQTQTNIKQSHIDNQYSFNINHIIPKQSKQTMTNQQIQKQPVQTQQIQKQPVQTQQQSTQTQSSKSNIDSTINYTIYPSHISNHNIKINHNQSFSQSHLNQVLTDMSHSFQMSDKFIQILKSKLLLIHQNLQVLQENQQMSNQSMPDQISQQKSHSNPDQSSSSQVQKNFKHIEVQSYVQKPSNQTNIIQYTYQRPHQQQQIQTVPKYNSKVFQGNVQTSKASTNCSITASFSYFSPFRHQNQYVINKVAPFAQIKQIQTQNVDSTIHIEPQCEVKPYCNSSSVASVNKSDTNQHIIIDQNLQTSKFELKSEKQDSGKKYEQDKKLSSIVSSPKNHLIQKQRSSQVNSPKNKIFKNLFKKSGINKIQKPKQLESMSQQQFDKLCSKYKPKQMTLLNSKQSIKMREQQVDNEQQSIQGNLQSNELFVLICESFNNVNLNRNIDVVIFHEHRVVSMRRYYEFEAKRVIVSYPNKRIALGNQQIILSGDKLKYAFKNKVNYFNTNFNHMNSKQIQKLKQQEFNVINWFKYKFR